MTQNERIKTAINWVDDMRTTLGAEGEIIEIDKDGDAKLKFPSGDTWWFQPNQLLVHRSSSDLVSIKTFLYNPLVSSSLVC